LGKFRNQSNRALYDVIGKNAYIIADSAFEYDPIGAKPFMLPAFKHGG
jgi:hypothetical protein